ncbi:MAG: carbon-nitrogen hydrolase [Fibrobacter sp.]|jgi:N-carbamoylputrescine amidase|nr:carbon-nitrogen hydrolase [Fibrobacter sp.]
MKNVSIALLQGKWCGDFKQTNAYYREEALKLAGKNVDLLILPELFHTPYFPVTEDAENFNLAIEKEDALIEEWREIAKRLGCVLVFPFFEKRNTGIYHNSAYVFERDGSIAGFYRKSHIPDDPGFYEKYYFIPGDTGFEPIATSAGKLGVLICWDQWFPEAARLMAMRGAEILIYPTAIGWAAEEPDSLYERQRESWKTVMRGHAVANRVFVVAANRVGTEGSLRFWGDSFISAPDGWVLAESREPETATLLSEIDLSEIEFQRHWWPHFRDRRTDLYQDILKIWGTP